MKNVSLPKAVLTVGGLAMVVYHAVASQYLYFSQWEHQTIHFAFLFLMVFMSYAIKAKSRLAAVGLYLCLDGGPGLLRLCVRQYRRAGNVPGLPHPGGAAGRALSDTGHGPGHVAVLGAAPAAGGRGFCGLFFFGHLLSGPLYHPAFGFDYVVSMLSVGLSGLYGLFMSISADQVFMFVVFGALLGIFKVEGLLMELGKILGRRLRGGAGLTGVVFQLAHRHGFRRARGQCGDHRPLCAAVYEQIRLFRGRGRRHPGLLGHGQPAHASGHGSRGLHDGDLHRPALRRGHAGRHSARNAFFISPWPWACSSCRCARICKSCIWTWTGP